MRRMVAQTSAADLRYPRKMESRTSVMMLCIAFVSYAGNQ